MLTHAKSMLIAPPEVAIDHLFPPYTKAKSEALALGSNIDDCATFRMPSSAQDDATYDFSKEDEVTQTIEEKKKAFTFETLFVKRDDAAAERFWAPNYIQHSAHIPPGREGLFNMIKGLPDGFRYENGLTVANGDYVMPRPV